LVNIYVGIYCGRNIKFSCTVPDIYLVLKYRKYPRDHIWRSTFGQVASLAVSSYRSGLPKVVMRERNAVGRQERRRRRRNGGRSTEARRRKRL